MAGLRGILGMTPKPSKAKGFTHPIAPDQPFLAIGDIHGRADLLERLERILLAEAPGLPAVFVGDYVDRGENSAQVIELLMSSSETGDQPVFCLKGNHEEMCLRFLDDPERYGERWLRFGGLQTLASYGVQVGGADVSALKRARDDLALAMGDKVIEWIRSRPTMWRSGNVCVTHAGADPARPLESQSVRSLLWGHKDFTEKSRSDGQWIVYGHVITDRPSAARGRIAVDTGAYATGRLTAALISHDSVRFLTT
jgi:serine/threonine protein phosphatase 1